MTGSNLNLQVIICTILCIICISSVSWAGNQSNLRQQLFEMDKAAALTNFDSAQKKSCIEAFNSRYGSKYALNDSLSFNEQLSLDTYDKLFWKGDGNLQRGLLFTASVTDKSGDEAGNLICYYAMTDYRMDFQNAYVMPLQMEETVVASNANTNNIQKSLNNFSSKE